MLKRVRWALRRTYVDLGGVVSAPALSASTGLALFPEEANTAADLLALADCALYVAKRRRRR